jgi:hypothetical protein
MPHWRAAGSTPSGWVTCWPATPWRAGSRSTRETPAPGRAATPSAPPSAACTTTRPGIRPASRSSPVGRSSGSASWALPGIPGPRRSTPAGCIPWTTPTSTPPARSARCLGGCPPAGRCRGLCSMPATTPRSCRWTWPTLVWWCWCGCAPTAASPPIRRHARPAPPAGRAATAPSSPSPTRPPGRPRPPATSPAMTSTAP